MDFLSQYMGDDFRHKGPIEESSLGLTENLFILCTEASFRSNSNFEDSQRNDKIVVLSNG